MEENPTNAVQEIASMSVLVLGYLDGLSEFAQTDEAVQVLEDWRHVIAKSVAGEKVDG
jgi:hypothetical protein